MPVKVSALMGRSMHDLSGRGTAFSLTRFFCPNKSGDSGGPILNRQNVIMGVVSWGQGCGDSGFPGVYARTSSADEFIRGGLCMLSANPPDYCAAIVPRNSACNNAVTLTPGSTVHGTTKYATVDVDAPTCLGVPTAAGVWYKVSGTGDTMTASLCGAGTSYDSKITVYKGQCGHMQCVDSDDDGCGESGGPSKVSWSSEMSTTYYILVHGYQSAMGDFQISITTGATIEPWRVGPPSDNAGTSPTGTPSLRPTVSPVVVGSDPPRWSFGSFFQTLFGGLF